MIGRVATEVVGTGNRRNVDDVAAISRHHAGNDEAAEMEHRPRVHVDEQVDVLGIGFKEFLRTVDARVVDQDVELDRLCEAGELFAVRHIDDVRNASGPFDKTFQRLSATGNRVDLQAFTAEALNHGGADPRRSASHESCLVIREGHGCPRWLI
jgi:hypothetical protein